MGVSPLLTRGDGLVWSGTAWAAAPAPLTATLNGARTAWTLPLSFAAGTLPDGPYALDVQVSDDKGQTGRASSHFRVDATAPALTIDAPVAAVPDLSGAGGVCSDGASGSGIAQLQLRLTRTWSGATETWNGTDWSVGDAFVPGQISAGRWSFGTQLPTGANLPIGLYALRATALDRAGNASSAARNITVGNDTTKPTIALASPAANAALTELTLVAGTATDAPAPGQGASGLQRVTVQLYRTWTGATESWDGTAWSVGTKLLLSSPNGVWNINTGLPSGANLPSGKYSVRVSAVDRSGNAASVTNTFSVVPIDKTKPLVTLDAPLNGAYIRSLSRVAGTATDAATGVAVPSGVGRVDVTLSRIVGTATQYWNGTAWAAGVAYLAPRSDTTWARTTGLPTGAQLPLGQYTLTARAYDRYGNASPLVSHNFTVGIAPVGASDEYSLNEEQPLAVPALGLLANDDGHGQPQTAALLSGPSHGQVTVGADGGFTYTPAALYYGDDSFFYTATNSAGTSNPIPVLLHVAHVNHAPTIGAISTVFTTPEETPLVGTLPVNDADSAAETAALVSILARAPAHGACTFTAGGHFVYTPSALYSGDDSFDVQVSDGVALSNVATVPVTVTFVNHPPVIQMPATTFTTPQNTLLHLLLHAADAEGDALTYRITALPSHGTLNGSGAAVDYLPAQDYVGDDTFTFVANDGQADSAPATISIHVQSGGGHSGDADGVDLSIRRPWLGSASWVGEGVVNATGQDQTIAGTTYGNTYQGIPALFELKLKNTGTVARQFTLLGPGYGSDGWITNYQVFGADGTQDYSAGWQITTDQGWLTPSLSPGATLVVEVNVAAQSWVTPLPTNTTLLFQAFVATGQPLATSPTDAVAANVTYQQTAQYLADLRIVSNTSGTARGADSYNPLPDAPNAYNQFETVSDVAPTGVTRAYTVQLQNNGLAADSFRLSLVGAVPAGWTVSLFDAATGGNDITSQLTGTGWQSRSVAAGAEMDLRLECTPSVAASLTSALPASVRAISVHDGNSVDVVTASVTRAKATLDLQVAPTSAKDTGVGAGVLNATGAGQTFAANTNVGQKVTAYVSGLSSIAGAPIILQAPPALAGWDAHYFDDASGNEVTAAITGAGWTTTTFQDGYYAPFRVPTLRVEITPVAVGTTAPLDSLLISGTAAQENNTSDAVGIAVTRNSVVDLMIASDLSHPYVGQGIANTTGANQRVALSQVEGGTRRMSFNLRVENDGLAPDSFQLTAPGSGDGWIVHYFDALQGGTGGNDITAAITGVGGVGGWTTPLLQPGDGYEIHMEVDPDPANPGQVFRNFLVSAASVADPTATDAVVAGVAFQKIVGVEYSDCQCDGGHWMPAPLLLPGDPTTQPGIPVKSGQILGLRGVPALPDFPWPLDPQVKPLWTNGSDTVTGPTYWLQTSGHRQVISAESGNTVSVALIPDQDVPHKYSVDLVVITPYLRIGGGADGQTTLTATVTDETGATQSGMTVRFRAYFADGTSAGNLGGSGADHNLAVTDAGGVATISLASDGREGPVMVEAIALLNGAPAPVFLEPGEPQVGPQLLGFYDAHPAPTTP